MVNFCKYSDTSITEGSDDAEQITTSVTTYHHHDDDDEFVCDSLSETEHSPFNNEHSFYSSNLFPSSTSSKGKSLLFTAIPNNGVKGDNMLYGSSQSLDSHNVFRNSSRNKRPLKAVDLDSTDVNHFLQANDRRVVRNTTAAGRVISGYASRDNAFQLDVPPDHHRHWIS